MRHAYLACCYLSVAALLCCAQSAQATKACLPSPCEQPGGGADFSRCRAVANWVAVGTLTEVVRHPQGPPLDKDFAEFTFTIRAWEKGAMPQVKSIKLQVGWCESPVPLPANTAGEFRFYGAAAPSGPEVPWQYLYFERLQSSSAPKD